MIGYFVVFIVLTIYLRIMGRNKESYIQPSLFLLSLYILSIICGIIDVHLAHETQILQWQYFKYAFVFIAYLFIFLHPYISFDESHITSIDLPEKRTLDIFSSIIIILSFVAIIFFFSGVNKVFSQDSLADARNSRYYQDISYVETGIMYTISSVSASLFVFSLLLFFVYLCIGDSKYRCILLFIGSFSEILHVLTEVGRDGVIFWLFDFVFFYLLFYDFIKEENKQRLRKIFFIVGAIILIPFMLISISRFEGNVLGDLVSYMGQQYKHFCYYFDFDPLPVSYGRSFPLYFEITGQRMPAPPIFSNAYTDSTSFGTFIRGFLTNFGVIGTFLVGLIMALIFRSTMKSTDDHFAFYKFFVYILYFQIFSQGVFYYRQYTRGANLFILLCFLLYFIFKHITPSGNNSLNKY